VVVVGGWVVGGGLNIFSCQTQLLSSVGVRGSKLFFSKTNELAIY